MGLFKKAEQSIFLGDVVRDFGVISEYKKGITRFTVTLLLCQKKEQKYLVFRQSARALFGASVTYHYVYQENLANLKQAIDTALDLTQG